MPLYRQHSLLGLGNANGPTHVVHHRCFPRTLRKKRQIIGLPACGMYLRRQYKSTLECERALYSSTGRQGPSPSHANNVAEGRSPSAINDKPTPHIGCYLSRAHHHRITAFSGGGCVKVQSRSLGIDAASLISGMYHLETTDLSNNDILW